MAKELPYFRFTVAEWMNGDISMENYENKGLFADICAWYWFKDCSVTKAMLEKKFSNARLLQLLYDSEIIKVINETIQIEFLDEQFDILSNRVKARQLAGSKGGKRKASNAKAKLKQNSSYKDKYNNKDNNKYNNKYKNIPPYTEFKEYAVSNKPKVDRDALKLKYESWVVNGWKDGNNNEIKNWKTKLLNTLPHLKESETIKRKPKW